MAGSSTLRTISWIVGSIAACVAGAAIAAHEGLEAVGDRMRDAVLSHDVKRIGEFVGPRGISCGDGFIPRRRVLSELSTKSSWLHAYFFDGAKFRREFKQPSVSEFLSDHPGASCEVRYFDREGRPDLDWGCITYRDQEKKSPELCFAFGGRWQFWQTPYKCD